jgi:hypothetical protein
MSNALTIVATGAGTLNPSSPAERSEGKGIQGLQGRSPSDCVLTHSDRPLLGPLPSAFGLAGGDGRNASTRVGP